MADAVSKIGDLAAAAGIRRAHLLSWRDLEDPEAGGSEVHAAELARCWAQAGIEVTWRSSHAVGRPAEAVRDGYRVIRRAGRHLVFPRAALAELARRHGEADALVEVWNGMPFFSPLWWRKPKVVHIHHVHAEMWRMVLGQDAPWLARLGDLIERRIAPPLYRRTRITTPSSSAKQDIVEMLRIPPGQISVCPNGVSPAFSPGGRRAEAPTVLAVGRLVPVKRHDLLVRAGAVAREKVGDLRLVVVGEGYERPRLEAAVRELGAQSWVELTGRISEDELLERYRSAWVVASASAREGWGLSLTEAAACGTPAVATRISGHLDAVADGVTGMLVEGTAPALGAALAQVLTDSGLRERLGAAALAHAARFSWEGTALEIMRALAGQADLARPRH